MGTASTDRPHLRRRPPVTRALAAAATLVAALVVAACSAGPSSRPSATPIPSPAEAASPSPATPSSEPEARARIRCEPDGSTTLLTPVVITQADGVHILTENPTGEDRSIGVEGVGGDNAGVGETETTWGIGPGSVRVRCFDTDLDAGLDIGWVTLTVVDPEGWFGPTALECPNDKRYGMDVDHVAEAPGASDPLDASADLVRDDGPSFTVAPAGYASETRRQVLVLDGGRPIALLRWDVAPTGGWLLTHVDACAGLALDWSD